MCEGTLSWIIYVNQIGFTKAVVKFAQTSIADVWQKQKNKPQTKSTILGFFPLR